MSDVRPNIPALRLPDQPLGMTNALNFKLTVALEPGTWKVVASANCYGRVVGTVDLTATGPADIEVVVPCEFTVNEAIPTGVDCVVSVTPG